MLHHEPSMKLSPNHPGLSFIEGHLETLTRLGRECSVIAEFGSLHGVSATAFLKSNPNKFISVDIDHSDFMIKLTKYKSSTEIVLLKENSLNVKLEKVDLLFVDSWHRYAQLKEELRLHNSVVSNYIVMHDTTVYEFIDEANHFGLPEIPSEKTGLWPAIREFLHEHHEWEIAERYVHNMGLTVLRRF